MSAYAERESIVIGMHLFKHRERRLQFNALNAGQGGAGLAGYWWTPQIEQQCSAEVIHGTERRSFTPEYKAEVVGLIIDGGKAISAVARNLRLTESAVRRWGERSEVDAGRGAPEVLTTVERDELSQLRRENRQLRMEREILKKATAFFAKESM